MQELFLFDDLFPPPADPPKAVAVKRSEDTPKATEKKEKEKKSEGTTISSEKIPSFAFTDGKTLLILQEKGAEKIKADVSVSGTDLTVTAMLGGKETERAFPFFLWNRREDLRELSEMVFGKMCFF